MNARQLSRAHVPILARQIGGEEAHYMPLRLKKVLADHGIQQTEWCAAVRQDGGPRRGSGLSPSMATMLLNWNAWPQKTSRASVKRQTLAFLRERGVPERVLTDALWEELRGPEERGARGAALRHAQRHMNKPRGGRPGAWGSDRDLGQINVPETEMLSHQAKRHFHLFQDPFLDDVQGPDDVFLSADQRYIREAMYQAARHGGFLAVVGESGAGKTVLRKDLIERIRREGAPVTVVQPRTIDKTRLTAAHIADAIIGDLSQQATPKRTLEAKARQIEQLLTGSSRSGNSHVLVIEEAHDLAVPTLKYLKRFWEMEDGFKRLLGIILVGQPELKAMLDERSNWEAREVIRRCEVAELRPLNGNLEQYLEKKFGRLSRPLAEVFDADAFDALRERLTQRLRGSSQVQSQLYPLVVNNAVRKAMNLAAEIGAARVSAEIVREV